MTTTFDFDTATSAELFSTRARCSAHHARCRGTAASHAIGTQPRPSFRVHRRPRLTDQEGR